MSDSTKSDSTVGPVSTRDRFAAKLGVTPQRKADIYLELSRSTTLTDPSYWLQTLFAAGIATLGLVLNSPAVIIGAMLISPLMGPILASGLALATGDVILGVRASLNLILSCLVAVSFAFLLVTVLPFKEITNEIAVRTRPTTLDLAVAFFSGAIGSIATCKEAKGVVTSIPGVAIAVALMPPLGVTGYGLALALSLSRAEGMQVAMGGGLLFLTNLVAITFTAMIVFLALHIDAPAVKEQMENWHKADLESVRFREAFKRLPGVPGFRHIGTLPARLMMIFVIILIILIPLSRSFNQLKSEISAQKRENQVRRLVTQTWQKDFGKLPNGEARSYLDHVFVTNKGDKLTLQLRVLTTKPLTAAEKDQLHRTIAAGLAMPLTSVVTQVIEIPTASAALKPLTSQATQAPLSVEQLQSNLFERIDHALAGLYLPPPAKLVDHQVATETSDGLALTLNYLSDRDIELDAQTLIQQEVKTLLDYPDASITLLRVPVSVGRLVFRGRETALDRADHETLDSAADYLKQHDKLRLEIVTTLGDAQTDPIAQARITAIKEYLASQAQIGDDRIVLKQTSESPNAWSINLGLAE